jgi:ADP-ribosylglycohydrolase
MISRAYGCLVGSAIGDAMGMPASFMSPEKIKQIYGRITDFLPPDKEQIPHGGLAEGEITDDTEESLIIAAVLIEAGKFDQMLFLEKMRDWAIKKRMLESTVIGPSTRRFLQALVNGDDLSKATLLGDTNGGAMRVAPVGIFRHGAIHQAIDDATASAELSHGSKPGLASTAAIAAAISTAVEGGCTPAQVMSAALQGAESGESRGIDIPAPSIAARIRLAIELVDRNRDKPVDTIAYILYQYIGASMKSYESIPFSLGTFYAAGGDYQQGLLAAINTGDDADTNGAIVGALCGAYCGAEKINPAWIEKLRQTNTIDFYSIACQLISHRN